MVVVVVVVVTAATTKPTMIVARYQQSLTYNTSSIVDLMESIQLTTVVNAATSSPPTKTAPSTLIKWEDGKRTHRVGEGSALHESFGGVRVK